MHVGPVYHPGSRRCIRTTSSGSHTLTPWLSGFVYRVAHTIGRDGSPEVVQIRDLLHAEPAELSAADAADHVVAGAVFHLHDQHGAAGARLHVTWWPEKRIL